MISDIIDISAKILPLLAIGDGIGSLTKEQYEIYSNKLLAAKETIINQFFEEFSTLINVNQEGFTKLLTENPRFSNLLYSHMVRELLNKSP